MYVTRDGHEPVLVPREVVGEGPEAVQKFTEKMLPKAEQARADKAEPAEVPEEKEDDE